MDKISSLIINGISACFTWFDLVMTSYSGLWSFVFSFICISITAHFFLVPIMGQLSFGSDFARSGKSGKSTDVVKYRKAGKRVDSVNYTKGKRG